MFPNIVQPYIVSLSFLCTVPLLFLLSFTLSNNVQHYGTVRINRRDKSSSVDAWLNILIQLGFVI